LENCFVCSFPVITEIIAQNHAFVRQITDYPHQIHSLPAGLRIAVLTFD
jgi:hypothetical protein